MAIKIPTVNEFNGMSLIDKAIFITLETGNRAGKANTVGFLIYQSHDLLIEFNWTKGGQIKAANAESLQTKIQSLIVQAVALQHMRSAN